MDKNQLTLGKREKVLLGILAVLVLFVVTFNYLLLPLNQKVSDAQAQVQELTEQKNQMSGVITDQKLKTDYQTEASAAAENYKQFYANLDTYHIDNIISGLMDSHGLHVQSLEMSKYQTVPESYLYTGQVDTDEAQSASGSGDKESLLLLSTVDLLATGSYENAMSFVDALNAQSPCLQVAQLQVDLASQSNGDEARVSAVIRVYGIADPGLDSTV